MHTNIIPDHNTRDQEQHPSHRSQIAASSAIGFFSALLGRSGTPVASWLMNEADLLIVIGVSFANHTGIAPYRSTVQIDDDHAAIGRFDAVTAAVLGDAAMTVEELADAVGSPETEDQRTDVAARWAIWRAEKARRVVDDRGRGVSAAAVFDALGRHLPADAVVTVDVGNHAYSLGRTGSRPVSELFATDGPAMLCVEQDAELL